MVYCSECGKKVPAKDKFCPSCGAHIKAGESASSSDTASQPAQAAVIPQQAIKPQPNEWGKIAGSIFGLIMFLILMYALALFLSPDSTSGNSAGTTTTGGSSGTASEGNGCSPGYCNSNGHCCPSNARYYCGGSCYYTIDDALSAGGCGSFQIKC